MADIPQPGEQFDPSTIDAAAVDPVEFANVVRTASDDQLADALKFGRELILGEIFGRMADHFDPAKAAGVEAVVDWKITGREDGGHDRYQLVISGGACEVQRDGERTPNVTLEVPAISFMRVATGNLHGPALYLSGGLLIEGDVALGIQMQTFFMIPAPTT